MTRVFFSTKTAGWGAGAAEKDRYWVKKWEEEEEEEKELRGDISGLWGEILEDKDWMSREACLAIAAAADSLLDLLLPFRCKNQKRRIEQNIAGKSLLCFGQLPFFFLPVLINFPFFSLCFLVLWAIFWV